MHELSDENMQLGMECICDELEGANYRLGCASKHARFIGLKKTQEAIDGTRQEILAAIGALNEQVKRLKEKVA